MNRGYSGYYNGVFLRSSYEFAFAMYLDYKNIKWTYEEREFQLSEGIYLPDFFIYDQDDQDKLRCIVEIKSGEKKEIQRAIPRLVELKTTFGIEGKLILFKDLKDLYTELPLSLNSVIKAWINSDKTNINKSISGSLNPHFGMTHSVKTKKLIGANTKERWSDPSSRNYMIRRLRESSALISSKLKGKIKVKRENRNCVACQQQFEVLITSKQKTCSQYCAGVINFQKATQVYVESRIDIHKQIRALILDWCKQNHLLVLETPYNRITTNLHPLFNQIHQQYNVRDLRVISKAVFGEDKGRKELLKFLKDVASEKIC